MTSPRTFRLWTASSSRRQAAPRAAARRGLCWLRTAAVALIQRGTCNFREKVENAQAAGAGVVIFNEGNVVPDDDRVGTLGTLDPPQVDIPGGRRPFAVGKELYDLLQQGPVTLRLKVDHGRARRRRT